MPQMSQVLSEGAIGMLTAGFSTRAVARELNVHFSSLRSLSSAHEKWGQKQKCCVYNFGQCIIYIRNIYTIFLYTVL